MLAAFAVCAVLMATRVLPALLALPLMALGIAALAGVGLVDLGDVVVNGTVRLAPVMATVIFGALLSRVTMQTRIAETVVAYAAEFGGDNPLVLALVMSAAVAALFTSLYGLGAIIMVGSIVLPIMLTVGVPRKTAATLFMLAYALGFIFNVSQWKFYTQTFGVERAQLQPYALALAGIDALALLVFVAVRFRSTRGYATWAMSAEEPPAKRRVPAYALLAPVLPIVLYFWLHVDPIVAFALAALYGVVTTQPSRAVPTLVSAAIRGVEDVAPALLLFMGIGMLLVAIGLPPVRTALVPVVGAIAPHGWLAYVLLFGLGSPLALYRGPLNPYGVGIGVYTVLAGLGVLPPALLVAAVMAVVQVQNACDPTNTQNVWVANFTGTGVEEIARFALPYQVAVATLAALCAVAFGPRLLGAPAFAFGVPAAAAAEPAPSPSPAGTAAANALPGLFAPSKAARTIAVAPARQGDATSGATAVYEQIAGGWNGFHATLLDEPPRASPCTTTPYTALVTISEDLDGPAEPHGIDAGLTLTDCAGWPVQEWHETQPDPPERDIGTIQIGAAQIGTPQRARFEKIAFALLLRMRTWMLDDPRHANALFDSGLAYDPEHDPPTYLYSLFKTEDGQMRAFVRPGGPAYASGLRTNDIVEKLDGRDWWEYGTYPTQARAYDGKPHVFLIKRGASELEIRLGLPLGRQ